MNSYGSRPCSEVAQSLYQLCVEEKIYRKRLRRVTAAPHKIRKVVRKSWLKCGQNGRKPGFPRMGAKEGKGTENGTQFYAMDVCKMGHFLPFREPTKHVFLRRPSFLFVRVSIWCQGPHGVMFAHLFARSAIFVKR